MLHVDALRLEWTPCCTFVNDPYGPTTTRAKHVSTAPVAVRAGPAMKDCFWPEADKVDWWTGERASLIARKWLEPRKPSLGAMFSRSQSAPHTGEDELLLF